MAGPHISFQVAAEAHATCLSALGGERTHSPAEADLIIVEVAVFNLPHYRALRERYRRAKFVAFVVWEIEELPEDMIADLLWADEIWTCSTFCQRALSRYREGVHIVPHVCEPGVASAQTISFLQKKLQRGRDAYGPSTLFYAIVNERDARKNVKALLDCFTALSRDDAMLVLKTRGDVTRLVGSNPRIVVLSGSVDRSLIEALHQLCDCYLSTHCSEGWGLGISEAMSAGNLAIATAYGGNMDYMSKTNSVPVPYHFVPIPATWLAHRRRLWPADMCWAEIDRARMVLEMESFCRSPDSFSDRRQAAAGHMIRFQSAAVSRRMGKRLDVLLQ